MKKPDVCQACKKGSYDHGSALYDYYSCGHAYQKPLSDNSKHPGKWVHFPSPYQPIFESQIHAKGAKAMSTFKLPPGLTFSERDCRPYPGQTSPGNYLLSFEEANRLLEQRLAAETSKDERASKTLATALRMLLNKVNAVTAPFRHGNVPSDAALTGLSNRQVEVEELLRKEGIEV